MDKDHFYIFSFSDNSIREINLAENESVTSEIWSSDSNSIYYITAAIDNGALLHEYLYKYNLSDNTHQLVNNLSEIFNTEQSSVFGLDRSTAKDLFLRAE
jgi:hypothetical protein